ncbi:competence protein CoiA [Falsibacillus pallidus]|uniref:Competence CoiA-like predicted nuclease n=1 Tax=Falsibacillus pallidus TaxID=493781 RepID=A0A370GWY1_9BACI|nr:competence protein CoiA family protein [Falsibacillus pallidus]RDI47760.1 competence CoiA-like predicted nuclease [Falsibacillus pallidus]
MISAKNENGDFTVLWKKPINEIERIRRTQKFYCPHCGDSLLIKAGSINIPHFSHKSQSACSSLSESESIQHLNGKLDIFNWLKQFYPDSVELEPYLEEIGQRPDILMMAQGQIYAIEYQCSSIPSSLIQARTKGYHEMNIKPIWIMGDAPIRKGKEGNTSIYKLSPFQWSFAQMSSNGSPILLSYSPDSKVMGQYSKIFPLTPSKTFAAPLISPLTKLDPSQILFNPADSFTQYPIKRWIDEKNKWMQQRVHYSRWKRDRFLLAIYENGLNPFLLAPQIGLPVSYMCSVSSHPLEWQLYIWTDTLNHNKGKIIDMDRCLQNVQKRIHRGDIKKRPLPLFSIDFTERMVSSYLHLLVRTGHLKICGKNKFMYVKEFNFYLNMEMGIEEEKNYYMTIIKDINRQLIERITFF